MESVADWLKGLGLERYEQLFAENFIDADVLRDLAEVDLEKIGVPLGHRKKLLRAIAELAGAPPPVPQAPVSSIPAAQESAERRQLTVMFCDLVGSTTLSTKLDPEDLRNIINAYHRCSTQVVTANGGFVAKYMGDGVLAYFGYPRASEHDAERAIRAALAIIDTVPEPAASAGAPLQVRIGIATGLVVVGDLIGTGAAQEQAVIGETPNLAARLQALAEPGAIVISAATRKLTGGLFDYCDLGTVALKGFGDPVKAWQVLGASAAESRFEALRTANTPLVGRDEEIDLLMRRWGQAKRGDGQLVLISGEPGIGKSRIAETIAERIGGEPHIRQRYFCSPHHQGSALYPIIAQIERAAGFGREDTPEQRLAKLETALSHGTNDLREVVPLLADLLSIPTEGHYPSPSLTPQKRKEKTLHALLAQVEGLAARQPLLMVWEDVHWSDPTTREALDLLIDRVAKLRVLAILTFRPEFAPYWVGRPQVSLVSLSRLPARERAEMIAHVTGGKALPKEIADQIVERTDGVPLFIEELTKGVLESGVFTEKDGRYAISGPMWPLAIPTSLHASLLARLDRLAPTREVAQIGAALGRSFSHELICAVAKMPRRKVDDALDQLAAAELIFQRGTPPDAEYTFKHALVQEAAYGTLLRSRRHQLHSDIVTTLEEQFQGTAETQPALLAYHCAEAGLAQKAVAYRLKASQQAMAHSAMAEAEAQIRAGFDILSVLQGDSERQSYELDLQMALGMILSARQGYAAPAVVAAFARARQLCEQLDRPSELAVLVAGQCAHHLLGGSLILACQEGQDVVNLGNAKDSHDIKFLGSVYSSVAWFHVGDFDRAREFAEKALTLYNPINPFLSWVPQDGQVTALAFVYRSLTYFGYLDRALKQRDQALVIADQRKQTHTLAMVREIILQTDAYIQADPAILLERADELVAYCAEHGFPYWGATALWHRGTSLSALGRTEEALTVLAEALASYQATGAVTVAPAILTSLAEALGKAGRTGEGLERLHQAEHQIETTQERWAEAELHRVRGALLIVADDALAAENSLCRALSVAQGQKAKLWELRAATSLAGLWRDQGKRTKAHDLLAPVYRWFTEGLDTPVLKEAKALLEQLSA